MPSGGDDARSQSPDAATGRDLQGPSDTSPGGPGGVSDGPAGAEGGGGTDTSGLEAGRSDAPPIRPDVPTASCPVQVTPGRYHACARKADGSLWCWGADNHGQLAGTSSNSPVRLSAIGGSTRDTSGSYISQCAVKSDGTLWCWGSVFYGATKAEVRIPVQVTDLGTEVVGVATASGHDPGNENTCAIKRDGTLWCWGANALGTVGDGTTMARPTPVAVTALGAGVVAVSITGHACAVKSDGTLWCWGNDNHGQVGDGMAGSNRLQPAQVSELGNDVIDVTVGGAHTCARTGDGSLWCWGFNDVGQLGDGTKADRPTPVAVSALGAGVRAVSAGIRHTCAIKSDGTLWCWGMGTYGQLGNGGTTDSTAPVAVTGLGNGVVDVSVGMYFSCAVKVDGTLWCWGESRNGQLGYGGRGMDTCVSYTGSTTPCQRSPAKVAGLCP